MHIQLICVRHPEKLFIDNPLKRNDDNSESISYADCYSLSENGTEKLSNSMELDFDEEEIYEDTEEDTGWDDWNYLE